MRLPQHPVAAIPPISPGGSARHLPTALTVPTQSSHNTAETAPHTHTPPLPPPPPPNNAAGLALPAAWRSRGRRRPARTSPTPPPASCWSTSATSSARPPPPPGRRTSTAWRSTPTCCPRPCGRRPCQSSGWSDSQSSPVMPPEMVPVVLSAFLHVNMLEKVLPLPGQIHFWREECFMMNLFKPHWRRDPQSF